MENQTMTQKTSDFPVVPLHPEIIITTTDISNIDDDFQKTSSSLTSTFHHPNNFRSSNDFCTDETLQDDSENSEMEYIHIPIYFQSPKQK